MVKGGERVCAFGQIRITGVQVCSSGSLGYLLSTVSCLLFTVAVSRPLQRGVELVWLLCSLLLNGVQLVSDRRRNPSTGLDEENEAHLQPGGPVTGRGEFLCQQKWPNLLNTAPSQQPDDQGWPGSEAVARPLLLPKSPVTASSLEIFVGSGNWEAGTQRRERANAPERVSHPPILEQLCA